MARETGGVGVEVRMWLAQILSSILKTDLFFPFSCPLSCFYCLLHDGVRAENSEGKITLRFYRNVVIFITSGTVVKVSPIYS